jgi:hypothetical protein
MNGGGEERLFSLVHQAWRMPAGGFIPGLPDTPPSGQVWRSYYYAGGQRVAERVAYSGGDSLYFILGDHLGSTTITTNIYGDLFSKTLYDPWGTVRYIRLRVDGLWGALVRQLS